MDHVAHKSGRKLTDEISHILYGTNTITLMVEVQSQRDYIWVTVALKETLPGRDMPTIVGYAPVKAAFGTDFGEILQGVTASISGFGILSGIEFLPRFLDRNLDDEVWMRQSVR